MWLTNAETLTANERAELAQLQRRFPQLAQLHQQRERFRGFFEDRTIHPAAVGAKQSRH